MLNQTDREVYSPACHHWRKRSRIDLHGSSRSVDLEWSLSLTETRQRTCRRRNGCGLTRPETCSPPFGAGLPGLPLRPRFTALLLGMILGGVQTGRKCRTLTDRFFVSISTSRCSVCLEAAAVQTKKGQRGSPRHPAGERTSRHRYAAVPVSVDAGAASTFRLQTRIFQCHRSSRM